MEALSKTKFGKGTDVEVMRRARDGTVSWLPGQIISGDGRTYSVEYGWPPTKPKSVLRRVPRKALRPAPPPVDGGMTDWLPADLVDVFDNHCWKKAMVVKVQQEAYIYTVKLPHSSTQLNVPKSHLRFRRSWEDSSWFVIGNQKRKFLMDLTNFEANAEAVRRMRLSGQDHCCERSTLLHSSSFPERKVDTSVSFKKVIGEMPVKSTLPVSCRIDVIRDDNRLPIANSSGMQKRKFPMYSSDFDAVPVASKKIKVSEKDCSHGRSTPLHPSLFPGEFDTSVSLKKKVMGKKSVHSTLLVSRTVDVVKRGDNTRGRDIHRLMNNHSSNAKCKSYSGHGCGGVVIAKYKYSFEDMLSIGHRGLSQIPCRHEVPLN